MAPRRCRRRICRAFRPAWSMLNGHAVPLRPRSNCSSTGCTWSLIRSVGGRGRLSLPKPNLGPRPLQGQSPATRRSATGCSPGCDLSPTSSTLLVRGSMHLAGCKLEFRDFGSPVSVGLVHREALLCDAVDHCSCIRIRCQETLEIGLSQYQQLAIGQSDHIGLPRSTRQQSHFPEEVAAAKPNAARRQPHLDRAGGNEIHRISAISSTENARVWHSKTW